MRWETPAVHAKCWVIPAIFLLLAAILRCSDNLNLSVPTIGEDGRIYTCADDTLLVFRDNGILAWSAEINFTCQPEVAPAIDSAGRVYIAAQKTVVVVRPPSSKSKTPAAADFFELIPKDSLKSIQGFSLIEGLAVSTWSAAVYINTGISGLHAFMFDGTPLWSTRVQFNESTMKSPASVAQCAKKVTECLFLSSPAIDQCDGSIYVARSDGWLYSFTSWQPFLRWRYNLNFDGKNDYIGVTAGNNGRIYVGLSKKKMIYAFKADLGSLLWQKEVGPLGPLNCFPVVDLLGWVSVSSLDGFLYAISPDGVQLKRYLAENIKSPLVIQAAPLLDCSGTAIYAGQFVVKEKWIDESNEETLVSFTQVSRVNIWMLIPSTGMILWSTWYPGFFSCRAIKQGPQTLYYYLNLVDCSYRCCKYFKKKCMLDIK